jgi:carboxymethylenebutenolidase
MGMIEFARPDGGKTKGYLATAGQGRPGIVVIQEWWGLNDQICGVADRFARAGYNALAPDLYKGRLTAVPDEANHLMSGLNFPDATQQDLRGAAQHLAKTSRKVGVMGFCMGGALTIAAAVHIPKPRRRCASTASRPRISPIRRGSGCRSRGISPIRTTGVRRLRSTIWKRR